MFKGEGEHAVTNLGGNLSYTSISKYLHTREQSSTILSSRWGHRGQRHLPTVTDEEMEVGHSVWL